MSPEDTPPASLDFESFFQAAPCFLTVQGPDLRIIAANDAFTECFGDAAGRSCHDVYKHRAEPCLRCPVLNTFHDGESHQSEELVTTRAGEQMNTLVNTSPIRNANGEIEMVMEMSTDITSIRTLQGRLTNLGLYVGSISHGLKGLLTGLDGGMYLLTTGREKNRPDRLDEGLRMVQRNVEHIRRVVLDLLNIAGERESRFEPVELCGLARDVVNRMTGRADDLQIDFQVELECEGETCEVDVRSLKGGLINFLENAFEACRIDNRKTEHFVRFKLTSEGDDAVFIIADNGIGMDRESREKMFSLSMGYIGTTGPGLGLFTANKVIEKHRGVVEVESEAGQGTSLHIRIPKVQGRFRAS